MVRALHKKCTVIHEISELVLIYKQPKIIPQRNEYITDVKLVCDIAKSTAEIITVDYARFIDAKNPPPISFDELLATWDEIDAALVKIQTMTHESMAQQEAAP